MNLLVEKTATNRHSDIFLRILHNICQIKLTLKNFKAVLTLLGHSKSKIFSVGLHWWSTFFRDLGPPNYFSAGMALINRYINTYIIEFSLIHVLSERAFFKNSSSDIEIPLKLEIGY